MGRAKQEVTRTQHCAYCIAAPHLEEEAVGELDAVVGSGLDVEAVPEVRGAFQHALDKFCLMNVELMTTVADSVAKFSGRILLFLPAAKPADQWMIIRVVLLL